MKKILTALLAGLVAAGSFATVSSAALAMLEELPTQGEWAAEAAYEDGTIVWFSNGGFNDKETAKSLFDQDLQTKWCHAEAWSFVTWEVAEPVSITGYQLVTANDNEQYPGRLPISWEFKGCNDYDVNTDEGTWTVIDTVTDAAAEGLVDLNWATFTFTDFDIEEVPAFKYYCFEVSALGSANLMQLSEFSIVYDGKAEQVVDAAAEQAAVDAAAAAEEAAALEALIAEGYVPAVELTKVEGITVLEGSTPGFSDSEGAASIFDYDTGTKWCSDVNTHSTTGNWTVSWEMPNAVAITGYQIATGNDTEGNSGRNPTAWVLSGSNDGSSWTEIDSKTGDTTLMAKNQLAFDFALAETAPAYKFFKLDINAATNESTVMQISEFDLIFDGAVAAAEETEATETEAPETEAPETEAPETEAPETEAPETEATETEEVVDVAEPDTTEEETEAPKTFDAAIIAGIAAVVSLAGYAVSKKH